MTRVLILAAAAMLLPPADFEPFAANVEFVEPFGVAFDRARNACVIGYKGNRLHKIEPAGTASVFAGSRDGGFAGDGGPASGARFHEPHGVVISPDQKLYIADTHNNRVRRIDLDTGIIATLAGNGTAGCSGDGGPAIAASFKGIFAIDLSPAGDKLYLADLTNIRVRMIDLRSGIVTTVAGTGNSGEPADGAIAAQSPSSTRALSPPIARATCTSSNDAATPSASSIAADASGRSSAQARSSPHSTAQSTCASAATATS
jgi:DNA-binding beta-propeller fold protein YncE